MFEGLLQPTHLILILGIALLIFGPKKLPELGKGIGEGIRGFKRAVADEGKPTDTQNVSALPAPDAGVQPSSSPATHSR